MTVDHWIARVLLQGPSIHFSPQFGEPPTFASMKSLRSLDISRRTAEQMSDVIARVFPQLEKVWFVLLPVGGVLVCTFAHVAQACVCNTKLLGPHAFLVPRTRCINDRVQTLE